MGSTRFPYVVHRCLTAYKPLCLRSDQAPLSLLLHTVSSHDQNNEKSSSDGRTELEASVLNGFRRAVQRAGAEIRCRYVLSKLHNPSPSEFRCTTFEALAANSFLLAMLALPGLQAQCDEGTRQLHHRKDKGASLV